MRSSIERADFNCLLVLHYRLVVLLRAFIRQAQIGVRVFVVGVDVDLPLESGSRFLILIVGQIGAAKIVPQTFVLGIGFRHTFEQLNR